MLLFESIPSQNELYLMQNRIDIWEIPLDQPIDLSALPLNEEEKNRANRLYFDHHRRRFIVAHYWLREILSRYLHNESETLRFTYNNHGKPQVINSQALEFNLSHSKEKALLAIGQRFPLGIDLEFFSARNYTGLANRQFSEEENQALFALPSFLKPLIFFRIWAQKEALIKAVGLGLAYPCDQFTVPSFPKQKEIVRDELFNKSWQMLSFMPSPSCCAALCYHPEVSEIRYIKV